MIRRTLLASLCSLTAFASPALAQEKTPIDQPLRGPSVKDDTVPGESRRFTGAGVKKKETVGTDTPHALFMRSLEVLRGEKADATVRLSSEQESKIEQISRELRESQQAYFEEHAEELAALREKAGPELRRRMDQTLASQGKKTKSLTQKPNNVPKDATPADGMMDQDKPMDSDKSMEGEKPSSPRKGEGEDPAVRTRVAEIAAGAPKPTDAHTKIWASLTASQRPVVEKQLAKMKAEAGSRRDGKKPASKPGAAGDAGGADLSKLPPKVQERLKNMTPEQREKAIERYRERQQAEKDKK